MANHNVMDNVIEYVVKFSYEILKINQQKDVSPCFENFR